MLLITTFVELGVVAGRSQMRSGRPQANSQRPCYAMALRRTAWAWHGKCESGMVALCKSNGKDTF